jgi:hypothetical protein
VPTEVRDLPQQDSHSKAGGEICQTALILGLTRAGRPFLLPYNVTEKVKLGSWDLIARLDECPVGALQTRNPGISGQKGGLIEASLCNVQANRFQISARGTTDPFNDIEDELIDV